MAVVIDHYTGSGVEGKGRERGGGQRREAEWRACVRNTQQASGKISVQPKELHVAFNEIYI